MLRQDKDASGEGNRPWRAALRPASRWPPRSAGRRSGTDRQAAHL